jgi:DNA-binding transcriptional MerR regulator
MSKGARAEPAPGDGSNDRQLLRMSELAQRSGVSAGTIRHYLREGLLGSGEDIVRTSRNMAYYPSRYVHQIALIKRLQQERFMPLRVIKRALRDDPERTRALIELEDRILEHALANEERSRVSARAVHERYQVPGNVLERLAEIGVLTPAGSERGRGSARARSRQGPARDGAARPGRPGLGAAPASQGYDPDDVRIIEAIARFRAGGYDEALGFTVYDTLRYREALEPLVREEVRALLDRLAGGVEVERALEIVAAGVEPLRELIGAIHSKLLLAELRRHRSARG